MVASPGPVQPGLGHRPVRPVRAGQHRAGPARGRRRGPHRRGDQPGRGDRHRRQRPLHPPRPVRRGAAGAGRGVPERGRDRRRADRGDQLPELRQPRGPGRDVAVQRGGPRPRRRLPAARHPGHRRQRQLLQPDRRDADPADAGGRRARRARRRRPPHADGLRRAGRRGRAARRDRRALRRVGVGVRRARAPRRHPAGGRPGRGAGAGRWCCGPRRCAARTTCPTAGWRRRWSSAACAGTGARPWRSDGDPFVALFSESTARALVSVAEDDLDRLAELADEHGVPCLVLGEVTEQPTLTVVDVLSVPLRRAAHRLRVHPARRCSTRRPNGQAGRPGAGRAGGDRPGRR